MSTRRAGLPHHLRRLALAALVAGTAAFGLAACEPAPQHSLGHPVPTLVAGSGAWGSGQDPADGTLAVDAAITPISVAMAPDRSIYLVHSTGSVLHIVDQRVYRVMGGGTADPGEGVVARDSQSFASNVDVAPDGTVYVSGGGGIFTLPSNGTLHLLPWKNADDVYPPPAPLFVDQINDLDVDVLGRVLFTTGDGRVRQLVSTGGSTILAGGGSTLIADGAVATASMVPASTVVGAPNGDVYFTTERLSHSAFWRLGSDGIVHAVSVSLEVCDTMPNNDARTINLAVDSFGSVYFAGDGGFLRIRSDGRFQYLGDANIVTVGPDDELVYGDIAHLYRSPPVVARVKGCNQGRPYTSAAAAVDAQLLRFHVAAPADQRTAWIDQMRNTQMLDPAELVYVLEHRGSYPDVVGSVSRLYQASFARPADTSGLTYWSGRRFAGMSLASIATTFATSAEFTSTYGPLSDPAFVDLLYLNVLHRPADPSGRAYWIGQLQQGASRGTVLVSFSESAEFVAAEHDTTEATLATFGLLARAPTRAELAFWHAEVADHHHQEVDLIASLWYSPEHAYRVGAGG